MAEAAAAAAVAPAEEETQSAIATMIGQVIAFIRQLARDLMHWVSRLLKWAGENPLAASTFFMNLLIWFS